MSSLPKYLTTMLGLLEDDRSGICAVCPDNRLVYWNEIFKEYLGEPASILEQGMDYDILMKALFRDRTGNSDEDQAFEFALSVRESSKNDIVDFLGQDGDGHPLRVNNRALEDGYKVKKFTPLDEGHTLEPTVASPLGRGFAEEALISLDIGILKFDKDLKLEAASSYIFYVLRKIQEQVPIGTPYQDFFKTFAESYLLEGEQESILDLTTRDDPIATPLTLPVYLRGNKTQWYRLEEKVTEDGSLYVYLRDATETISSRAERDEMETIYRGIMRAVNDIILRIDHHGNIKFTSEAIRNIAQFEPDDLLGLSFASLVADECKAKWRAILHDFKNNIQPEGSKHLRINAADGHLIDLEISVSYSDAGAGMGREIILIGRDMRLRLEHEKLLQQQTEKLEEIFATIEHGIAFYDESLQLVAVNENYGIHMRMPMEDLQGSISFQDITRRAAERGEFQFDDPDEAVDYYMTQLAHSPNISYERGAGRGRYLKFTRTAMPNGGFLEVVTDTSEQRKTAQALRESESRLTAFLVNAPVAMYLKDRQFRYILTNPRLESMLGETEKNILGQTDFDLLSDHDAEIFAATEQEILNSGTTLIAEETRIVAGEQRSIMAFRFPLRDVFGNITALGGFFIDITQQKTAEQKTRDAMEEADRANRSKSVFLANMSHELRTPLNAIIGFSQIIHQELFGPIGNEKYSEYGHDIGSSAGHLLGVIGKILDMSKIDAGKFELFEEEVNLIELITSTNAMLRQEATTKGIEFPLLLEDGELEIYVDAKSIRQVILNIYSNALKFTNSGGTVVTRQYRENIDGQNWVAIEIADSGIGIEPKVIQQLFEPFEMGHAHIAREKGGTGLGLWISRSLVELQGGTLDLESKPGFGTQVKLRLPATRIRLGKSKG